MVLLSDQEGFQGFNINLEDILGGDFFSNIFGGGRRSSAQNQGNDILIRHEISLESVLNGNKEEIEIDLPSTCNDCNGTGAKDGVTSECQECNGAGQVRIRQQIGPFVQIQYDHAQIVKVQVGNSLTGVKPALEMEGYQSLKC